MTDICVQDLPRAVGETVGGEASGGPTPETGGSGALMIMPDVSVVCGANWPAACFWTTSPNLDQTPVAVAAASGCTAADPPSSEGRTRWATVSSSASTSASGGIAAAAAAVIMASACRSRPLVSSRRFRRHGKR